LVNPSPDMYRGRGFIAAFVSQLEDDFFEHSLEDLKVGAGGLRSPLNPDLDPVFLVNPSRYVSGRGFYCNIRLPTRGRFLRTLPQGFEGGSRKIMTIF
jgi:hypothetical protein